VHHASIRCRIHPVAQYPRHIGVSVARMDVWVLDALRRKPHPTHAHLALSLAWIAKMRPARAVLTNMHLDMDYATLVAELPPGVTPAHDGIVISFENVA